jgi:hypothetical protein
MEGGGELIVNKPEQPLDSLNMEKAQALKWQSTF